MGTRGVDPERPLCPHCYEHPVTAGHIVCVTCTTRIPRSIRASLTRAHTMWAGDPTDHHWSVYMRIRHQALDTLKETQP